MNRARTAMVLLVTAGLLALAVALLPGFVIEPDLARSLPSSSDNVKLSELLDTQGESRRSVFLVLRGDIDERRLGGLVTDLRTSPFLSRVAASKGELFGRPAAAPLWHMPEPLLSQLQDRLLPKGRRAALQATLDTLAQDPLGGREVAIQDPLGLRWILGELERPQLPFSLRADSEFAILQDGRRALVRLVGTQSSFDAEFSRRLLEDVEQRLSRQRWTTDLTSEYDMFGGYVIARADADRIRSDLRSSILWSCVLVTLYLGICLRGLGVVIRVLTPLAIAIFCAVSIGATLFGPLTPVAIASAAVLLGLGVDFAIHYVARYCKERTSSSHTSAASHTGRKIGPPLFVGMLTSSAAFVSLAVGEFSGLAGFGLLLAFGLVLAFLGTWYLLPLLLGTIRRPTTSPPHSFCANALDRLAAGPRGKAAAIGLCLLAAVSAGVVSTRGVDIRVAPEHLRPSNDFVSETRSRLEQELGISMAPVCLLTPTETDPTAVRAAVRQLRDEGRLAFSTGPIVDSGTRRRRIQEFHKATAGWKEATLRAMDDLGFAPDPFRPGLETFEKLLGAGPALPVDSAEVAAPASEMRIDLCYLSPDMMQPSNWGALQSRTSQLLGERAYIYGTPTLLRELRQILARDLLQAVIITGALTLLLVMLMAGSLTAGLFALLPAVCGLSITLAALAICEVPLSLGNFVAIPFLLGIAVDDGVHLVAHLRRRTTAGTGATGVAVVRTSLTTVLAFGSLSLAQSPGLASMGWIIMLGVSCCLLTSLLVLPPLWPNKR